MARVKASLETTASNNSPPSEAVITRSPTGPGVRRELAIVAGFGLLAIIFTWPLVLHLGQAVPGTDDGDAWQMVWNLWWVRYALEHGQNPFQTDMMFYPQGTGLYLHALNALNGLVSWPVQYLAGALGAPADGALAGYNFIVWLNLTLGAYGAFGLARYLWGDGRAALVAGLAYGFSTYNFDHLLGHLNLVSSELIPFYILFFLKMLHPPANVGPRPAWRGGLRYIGLTALCLVGMTFLELQYIFYLAIFSAVYLLYIAVGWLWQRFKLGQPRFDLGVVLLRSGLMVGLYLLLTAPFWLALLNEALHNPNTVPERQERVYSADLLAYFYPSPFHPLWGGAMRTAVQPFTATLIEKIVFPGFVVYGLILVGLILARRVKSLPSSAAAYRPGPTWWLIVAGVFAVLSFGPRLHINGIEHGPLLPGNLIYSLPILNISRVPSRFAVIALLALAVLAAWGLSRLGSWLRERPRLYTGLVSLFLLGLAFELLPAPYVLAYYNVPNFYHSLVADPRTDYAVLELPLNYGKYQYETQYLEAQMTSHKPITNGYISRNPVFPPYYGLPVFTAFRDFAPQPGPDILPSQPLDPGVLRYFGVRYIVVRKDIISGHERSNSFEIISQLLPGQKPFTEDDAVAVYEVPFGPKASFFYNLVLPDWYGPEKQPGGGQSRWVQGPTAAFDFWTTEPRSVQIEFPAWSFHDPHPVEFWLNGHSLGQDRIETSPKTIRLTLDLTPDQNRFEIKIGGPPVRPSDLAPGPDTRSLTISIGEVKFGQ